MKTTNPTTAARRRYLIEFWIAIVAYMLVLFFSVYVLRGLTGPWVYPVALLPVIPIIGVLLAVIRWMQSTDELERQLQTTSLAVAGGITMMYVVTYGFLENAGLPHASMWFTYGVFMISWGVARFIVQRYYQ